MRIAAYTVVLLELLSVSASAQEKRLSLVDVAADLVPRTVELRRTIRCNWSDEPPAALETGLGAILGEVGGNLLIVTAMHNLYYRKTTSFDVTEMPSDCSVELAVYQFRLSDNGNPRTSDLPLGVLEPGMPDGKTIIVSGAGGEYVKPGPPPYRHSNAGFHDIALLLVPTPSSWERTAPLQLLCPEEDEHEYLYQPTHYYVAFGTDTRLGGGGATFEAPNTLLATHPVCPGDSGGPLFVTLDSDSCRNSLYLYGVIQWADPGSRYGAPQACNASFRTGSLANIMESLFTTELANVPVKDAPIVQALQMRKLRGATGDKLTPPETLAEGQALRKAIASFLERGRCGCRTTAKRYDALFSLKP